MSDDQRMIEDYIPVAEISAAQRRACHPGLGVGPNF